MKSITLVIWTLILVSFATLATTLPRNTHAGSYGGSLVISHIETANNADTLLVVTKYPVTTSGEGKQTRVPLDHNIDHTPNFSIAASTMDLTLNELYVLLVNTTSSGSALFSVAKFDCGDEQPKLIEIHPFAQGIKYDSATEFVQGFFYVNRLMGSGYLMAVLRLSSNTFNIYMVNPFDVRQMNLVTTTDLPPTSLIHANRGALFNLRTEKFYLYDSNQATVYQIGPYDGQVQSLDLKKLVPYFDMEDLNPILFYNMTYGGSGSLYLAPSTSQKSPAQPLFEIIPNSKDFRYSVVREVTNLKFPSSSYKTMCIYEDTVLTIEAAQFHGYSMKTGKLVFQSEYLMPTPSWISERFGLTYTPYH